MAVRESVQPHAGNGASADSSIEELVKLELGDERGHGCGQQHPVREGSERARQPWLVRAPRDLVGLALSGGGLRSATFNLGLLQGLHKLGLLNVFDYLSTVSGGGYIGGFWSAWRYWEWKRSEDSKPPREMNLFPLEGSKEKGSEHPAIRHLREFGNFLSPNLGILGVDAGRVVVALLNALVCSLLSSLALVILVLVAWVWSARLLLDGGHAWVSHGAMFVGTLVALFVLERFLGPHHPVMNPDGKQGDTSGRRMQFILEVAAVVFVAALTLLCWWWVAPEEPSKRVLQEHGLLHGQWAAWGYSVLAPSAAWGGAALMIVALRWLFSRAATLHTQQLWFTVVDRINGRLLLLAGTWAAIAVLWRIAGFLYTQKLLEMWPVVVALSGILGGLIGVFTRWQHLLSQQKRVMAASQAKARQKSRVPQLLAQAILALLLLGLFLLLFKASQSWWADAGRAVSLGRMTIPVDYRGELFVTLVAFGIVLFALLFFDVNRMGLHTFYRARIARAFLGGAHGKAPGETELQVSDNVSLDQLARMHEPGSLQLDRQRDPGPLHLICCTANDLGQPNPMANLHRGAESAVLSPVAFSVAGEWASWKKLQECVKTRRGIGRKAHSPTLACALTASGAAFNSLMGSLSMELGPAVTFLMTTLNFRLGLWWPHPIRARHKTLLERCFCGLPFYKELLGRVRADGRDVHLSDGGHFENLALYELVRRHCRYIVVSDCGMDPDVAFKDFGNAVRRVREDFGVEIRIDLSPLYPGPDGLSRQPMVSGDIVYPEGDHGILLLFKPTLVGGEPPDILQYKARNGAFPHEKTGDQFYDEAQWESYRRLGVHAATTAFQPVLGQLQPTEQDFCARLFTRARREWLPVPAGYEERFSRFAERVAGLDALLQRTGGGTLLRQVFQELNALAPQRLLPSGGSVPPADAPSAPAPRQTLAGRFVPESKDLVSSLHLVRRVVLLMEEVFLCEHLEENHHHPAYLGVINYFARWSSSPLFRLWWPLLKGMYPQRFTRFMEQRFGLACTSQESVVALPPGASGGFALDCWRQQPGGRSADEGEVAVVFRFEVPYAGRHRPYQFDAALALVQVADGVAVWKAEEFFVPPGLWGIGIGENFLHKLTEGCEVLDGVSHLVVMLPQKEENPAATGLEYIMPLYRSCGFLDARIEEGMLLSSAHEYGIVLEDRWLAEGSGQRSSWLMREVGRS